MKNVDVPVVVLGDVAPKCQWYLDECRCAWLVPRFSSCRNWLAPIRGWPALCAACGCLVVGSGVAGPERIALAVRGASGTPLVLFEGSCSNEYFGEQAVYVRPDDVPGIRRGVQRALDRKRSKDPAEHVCTYFSWKAVARTLRDAYGQACRKSRTDGP